MLVIAAEPLRSALTELARSKHLDVHTCTTPLDTCQALERASARLAYAIISSDTLWGLELRQLLEDEYPEIKSVMLIA